MLAGCVSETGIVTGITSVSEQSFFSKMQRIDWWLTLGMVKVLDDLGIAITSMGNNMLISREAYEKVGGFEGIPFSLTEDLEIAKKIKEHGYKGVHQVSPKNLIHTSAISGFIHLLQQRKRWMSGALSLPMYWQVLLLLQVLFFPFILFLLATMPVKGLILWVGKIIIQGIFLRVFSGYAGQIIKIRELIIFEIYYLFISWSTIVYYFWPSKTNWKGRLYP
jgi:cellulose synthase/poly-beta-1,6-N-acetylglucosamine synthase-like glycosyltransferase